MPSISRSKIWLHGVSPDGKPSGYSLPSPLKRAEIAVFRRLGYISPRIHSRAKRRWTRNLDLLSLPDRSFSFLCCGHGCPFPQEEESASLKDPLGKADRTTKGREKLCAKPCLLLEWSCCVHQE